LDLSHVLCSCLRLEISSPICIFTGLGAAFSVLSRSIFLRVFLSPGDGFGFVAELCCRGEYCLAIVPWTSACRPSAPLLSNFGICSVSRTREPVRSRAHAQVLLSAALAPNAFSLRPGSAGSCVLISRFCQSPIWSDFSCSCFVLRSHQAASKSLYFLPEESSCPVWFFTPRVLPSQGIFCSPRSWS
jgi:hypothetical protein